MCRRCVVDQRLIGEEAPETGVFGKGEMHGTPPFL
jgi:hypothetical protein